MKRVVFSASSAAFLGIPLLAFAQVQTPQRFADLILLFIQMIQGVVTLGWAFIAVGFAYGIYKFLLHFDDEHAREEGKRLMVWSVIGAAVGLGIYGILAMLHYSVTNGGFGVPVLSPPNAGF